jgi:exoribonuclease R
MEKSGSSCVRRTNVARSTLAEAVLLQDRIGEEFSAAVLDVAPARSTRTGRSGRRWSRSRSMSHRSARGACGSATLGQRVRVRLTQADPGSRTVLFELVST